MAEKAIEIKEKEKEVEKVVSKEVEKGVSKEKDGVITAVYKANLHCLQCARDIEGPLLRTEGVHNVDVDMEKGEIKAKGSFDPIKVQKRIEKLSKMKIELISPKIDPKTTIQTENKVVKETKQAIPRTTSVKVHMHCDQCARDLKKKLLMQKDIHSVKTDMKSQILTVDGTVEPDKLVSFLRRKVHKHAEIIPEKNAEIIPEKKEERKEKIIEEKKEKEKVIINEGKSLAPSVKTGEIKEETKVVEAKIKEGNAPYIIHYVDAPQLFSDENPNACTIS